MGFFIMSRRITPIWIILLVSQVVGLGAALFTSTYDSIPEHWRIGIFTYLGTSSVLLIVMIYFRDPLLRKSYLLSGTATLLLAKASVAIGGQFQLSIPGFVGKFVLRSDWRVDISLIFAAVILISYAVRLIQPSESSSASTRNENLLPNSTGDKSLTQGIAGEQIDLSGANVNFYLSESSNSSNNNSIQHSANTSTLVKNFFHDLISLFILPIFQPRKFHSYVHSGREQIYLISLGLIFTCVCIALTLSVSSFGLVSSTAGSFFIPPMAIVLIALVTIFEAFFKVLAIHILAKVVGSKSGNLSYLFLCLLCAGILAYFLGTPFQVLGNIDHDICNSKFYSNLSIIPSLFIWLPVAVFVFYEYQLTKLQTITVLMSSFVINVAVITSLVMSFPTFSKFMICPNCPKVQESLQLTSCFEQSQYCSGKNGCFNLLSDVTFIPRFKNIKKVMEYKRSIQLDPKKVMLVVDEVGACFKKQKPVSKGAKLLKIYALKMLSSLKLYAKSSLLLLKSSTDKSVDNNKCGCPPLVEQHIAFLKATNNYLCVRNRYAFGICNISTSTCSNLFSMEVKK